MLGWRKISIRTDQKYAGWVGFNNFEGWTWTNPTCTLACWFGLGWQIRPFFLSFFLPFSSSSYSSLPSFSYLFSPSLVWFIQTGRDERIQPTRDERRIETLKEIWDSFTCDCDFVKTKSTKMMEFGEGVMDGLSRSTQTVTQHYMG